MKTTKEIYVEHNKGIFYRFCNKELTDREYYDELKKHRNKKWYSEEEILDALDSDLVDSLSKAQIKENLGIKKNKE